MVGLQNAHFFEVILAIVLALEPAYRWAYHVVLFAIPETPMDVCSDGQQVSNLELGLLVGEISVGMYIMNVARTASGTERSKPS